MTIQQHISANIKFKNKENISWLVFQVPPSVLNNIVWREAFQDENFVYSCCKELGWDGGTIHQVINEVRELQKIYI